MRQNPLYLLNALFLRTLFSKDDKLYRAKAFNKHNECLEFVPDIEGSPFALNINQTVNGTVLFPDQYTCRFQMGFCSLSSLFHIQLERLNQTFSGKFKINYKMQIMTFIGTSGWEFDINSCDNLILHFIY